MEVSDGLDCHVVLFRQLPNNHSGQSSFLGIVIVVSLFFWTHVQEIFSFLLQGI